MGVLVDDRTVVRWWLGERTCNQSVCTGLHICRAELKVEQSRMGVGHMTLEQHSRHHVRRSKSDFYKDVKHPKAHEKQSKTCKNYHNGKGVWPQMSSWVDVEQ